MKSIFRIIDILSKQIEFITGIKTVVLNSQPSVFDEKLIYIIAPSEDNINIEPCISSDARSSFTVEIFQIAHEKNMNRQGVLVDDVHKAMQAGDTVLYKSIPRLNGLNIIDGAVIKNMSYGTSTWVTDTKIMSAFKITLSMDAYLDY